MPVSSAPFACKVTVSNWFSIVNIDPFFARQVRKKKTAAWPIFGTFGYAPSLRNIGQQPESHLAGIQIAQNKNTALPKRSGLRHFLYYQCAGHRGQPRVCRSKRYQGPWQQYRVYRQMG